MRRRITKSMFINAFTEREYRVSHKAMNECLHDYEKLLNEIEKTMKKWGLK